MGSVRHPRGRLPRRVYWVRRTLVLAVALALVFGIGKLVGATGSDDSGSALEASTTGSAQEAAAEPSVTMGPVAPTKRLRPKAKVPLAMPNGECREDEITVVPSVPQAWAGGPIVVQLKLQGTQPACTFEASAESVVVKIASGDDRIWSSQDCPRSVEKTSVVVRSGAPVEVPVTWNGRRSDADCAKLDWALPGFYHVYAAVLGSAPSDVQFEVTRGPAVVKTRTPKPKPTPSSSTTPKPTESPKPTTQTKPSRSPRP